MVSVHKVLMKAYYMMSKDVTHILDHSYNQGMLYCTIQYQFGTRMRYGRMCRYRYADLAPIPNEPT